MANLQKCVKNKTLFGVCCGISRFLNIDVSVVRLLFILGAVFSGTILLWIYLIMSMVLPKAQSE